MLPLICASNAIWREKQKTSRMGVQLCMARMAAVVICAKSQDSIRSECDAFALPYATANRTVCSLAGREYLVHKGTFSEITNGAMIEIISVFENIFPNLAIFGIEHP